MTTTLLHLNHSMDQETRQQLCASFAEHGVYCDSTHPSTKAQLMFVSFDEHQTAPSQLIQIAATAGHPVHLVDI
ncbi:MAG: hypothetical protein IBX49_11755 [Gammaproteobacteria bacterium]|nr:hypothetical protein [Gammaproteobacteria bacterium]